ncbi:MAG: CoA-binding protein [Myxococcota bacterium]
MELTTDDEIRSVLEQARVVAVLGAHPDRERPAFYVPDYLHEQGIRIIPVNPGHAGKTLWGETVRESLKDIDEPVDVVDVFRGAKHLPDHLEEFLTLRPKPGVIWFQKGIRHDQIASALTKAGLDVVQDRCMYADHRDLKVPPVSELEARAAE